MIRAAIIAAALAAPVYAEPVAVVGSHPVHTERNATVLRLGPPTAEGAVATLSYINRGNNHRGDTGAYSVEWHGIALSVHFAWNAQGAQDEITVETPPGYVPVPRSLSLDELARGEIQIIRWEGM